MRMMLAGSVHRLFQVPSSKADLDVYKTINQSRKSKAVAVLNSIPSTFKLVGSHFKMKVAPVLVEPGSQTLWRPADSTLKVSS